MVGSPFHIDRSYYGNGQLKTIEYPETFSGEARLKVEYAYDSGKVSTATQVAGGTEVFYSLNEVDAWGNAKNITAGNGVQTTKIYNEGNGWLDSIVSTNSAGSDIQRLGFQWDKVGNLTQRSNIRALLAGGSLNLVEDFVYDALYRLDTATIVNCTPTPEADCQLDVNYTANGNIGLKSDVGDEYLYEGTNDAGPHAVTTIKNNGATVATYDYDANGNMTNRNGNVITWRSFNKPAVTTAGDGRHTIFEYDANHRRVRQLESDGNQSAQTTYIGGIFELNESFLSVGGSPIEGFRQYVMVEGNRVATVSNVQSVGDTDNDSHPDGNDNCALVSNNDQRDTNQDGFGNICDPDLDNDGSVNFLDMPIFQASFLKDSQDPEFNPDADFNGDDVVNFLDLVVIQEFFLSSPGPANSIELGTSIQYFHTDHLSSIESMTDEDGELVATFSYDAFGQNRNPNTWLADIDSVPDGSEWTATTRGYTDHERLRSVGLVHMNGRLLDPVLGRVISADPYVPDPIKTQSYNRYSYVYNNPLSLTDPSGYNPATEPESETITRADAPNTTTAGTRTGHGAGNGSSVAGTSSFATFGEAVLSPAGMRLFGGGDWVSAALATGPITTTTEDDEGELEEVLVTAPREESFRDRVNRLFFAVREHFPDLAVNGEFSFHTSFLSSVIMSARCYNSCVAGTSNELISGDVYIGFTLAARGFDDDLLQSTIFHELLHVDSLFTLELSANEALAEYGNFHDYIEPIEDQYQTWIFFPPHIRARPDFNHSLPSIDDAPWRQLSNGN